MGEVYRARDPRLGREVAVKVLPGALAADAERLRRFEREARAAGALNHPNILTVHDVGEVDGRPFLVTELLEGETLRERLRNGALPAAEALAFAAQVAEGLAAAHARGVVHRDLKPENVFVSGGRVKILDFGLAKLARKADHPDARGEVGPGGVTGAPTLSLAATAAGTLLGTVGYMAPEQVRGEPADERSDLFAFGAILYEMLSGRRAFAGDSAVEVLSAILREEPAEIRDPVVPAAAVRLVRRCLTKEPAGRFHAARDLAFALEALASPGSGAGLARREDGRKAIAVLLFRDLEGGSANAHLGIGLADAIITELARLKSLLVRPTSATLRLRDRDLDSRQAGLELRADAVVEGSFQRAGDRLRVTVQVVSTDDGRPLWGGKVDTTLDDVFRVQDEVARRVVEALSLELSPGEERRPTPQGPPPGRAYELYLKGRLHFCRETLEDMRQALACFEEACAADPEFALAWAGLGNACAQMAFTFEPGARWREKARAATERALALDPALPEGRFLKGKLSWTPEAGFDHAGALREACAAIEARPNLGDAHHLVGLVLLHVSFFEEAVAAFDRCLAIDPGDLLSFMIRGYCRFHQGRYQEALEVSEEAARRAPAPWAYYQAALCRIQLGQAEEARRAAEESAHRFPGGVLFLSIRGLVSALGGDREGALRQVRLVEERWQAFGHYHHAQYDVACIYAQLGETDLALEWLEAAAGNGYPCHRFFARDPLLASLRYEERFARLLRTLAAECGEVGRLYRSVAPAATAG